MLHPKKILFFLFFFLTFQLSFSQNNFSSNPISNLDSAEYYGSIDRYKTRDFINKAFEQSMQLGDTNALIRTLILSGREHHFNGDSEKGRNELYQALMIAGQKKDETLKSNIYDNLGLNFRNNYNFDRAIYYFDKSIKIKIRNKDTLGWANIISNKANIYRDQKLFEKAISYNDSALTLMNNYRSSHLYYELFFLRSNYFTCKEDFDSSYYYMDKYRIYAENTFTFECTQTYIEFATLCFKFKKNELAKSYYNKALASINPKTNSNTLLILYCDFSRYHELNGDYKMALENLEKAYVLLASSTRQKLGGKMNNVETEFKLFKEQSKSKSIHFEKELADEKLIRLMVLFSASLFIIILLILLIVSRIINHRKLKEQKNELRNKNENLLKINLEKDALMTLITHNLKTPLVGINYLVKSLINNESSENIEVNTTVKTIYTSIGQMLDLTDEIIESSKSTHSNNSVDKKEEIKLNAVIKSIIAVHSEHAKEKNIEIKYINGVTVDTFIHKRSIIHIIDNLLSNAVKYSENNTVIRIQSQIRNAKYMRIEIENQGNIKPVEKESSTLNISNPNGNSGSNHSSGMGLLIVKKYIIDLNGKLWYSYSVDNAIRYSFIVPIEVNKKE